MKFKYQDKTLLLRAGHYYDLSVLKLLNINGDQPYFICVDENGLKHLIPVKYYRHYGIKAGDRISCRLDRINCQGRFYFEPEHPFYKREGVYNFRLISLNKMTDGNNYTARVSDRTGKEWDTLPFEMKVAPQKKISSLNCRIKSLKKARLYLELADLRLKYDIT